MQYGVHIHQNGALADPTLLVAIAREAEAAGWDGVFVCDYLMARSASGQPLPVASPWIALTAIAMATTRVRIGPLVTPLPRRRPWQLAAEAATLDHLANGRVILGVGSGTGLTESFLPFGEEPELARRAAMLDEGLAILAGLWSGAPVTYAGHYYQLNEAVGLPRPVQQPRIPLWVAGNWPHKRPFRRAAAWDGFFADAEGVDWVNGAVMSPEQLAEIVAYTSAQRTSDRPFDVVIGGRLPVEPRLAGDWLAPYAAAGLTWWIEGIHTSFGPLDEQRARIRRGPPPQPRS